MSDAAASGGSTVGSPAAGAVAPSRMSDLANGGTAPASGAGRMSDLGSVSSEGALPSTEKMTPLTGPFGKAGDMHEPLNTPKTPELVEPDASEPVAEPEAEPEAQQDGALTPEQQLAQYKEWMESDQIPEAFLDRPIWVSDGKGGQVPVRLRDAPNNMLLYNDYQRKTTELGVRNRQNDAREEGIKRWGEDVRSGDNERALRAMRAIGADKSLESIVVAYVRQMAELEAIPPHARERILKAQQAEDRAYYAEQQLQQLRAQQQQLQTQEAEQQGASAPDIKYVQDSITQQLPDIYKALNIRESPAIDHILSTKLAEAATGVRDPQSGQWITPPTIQLGRAPTRELLTQLVLAAKQQADAWAIPQGQPLRAPAPPTKPIQGSGPAAKPGQRGNLSTPQRQPFSALANRKVSG
jgi:hypothetical protein